MNIIINFKAFVVLAPKIMLTYQNTVIVANSEF